MRYFPLDIKKTNLFLLKQTDNIRINDKMIIIIYHIELVIIANKN